MFSKLAITLAMAISLITTPEAFAQVKKSTATQKADEAKKLADDAKKAEEARLAEEAKKAAEVKKEAEAKAEAEKNKVVAFKPSVAISYHGEFYGSRRVDDYLSAVSGGTTPNEKDKDIQDLKIMHNPSITVKPMKDLKFLVTSEFKYTDAISKGTFINRHYRSLVSFTRENVLTESDNGFKLDLGVARRIFDRNKGKASSYGNSRLFGSMSKKVNDKLSGSLFVQYLANDPVHSKVTASTWKHSIELIPSFTFQITDKLSYFFNDDFIINSAWISNNDANFDFFHEMNLAVLSYQITDKLSTYFQYKYIHTSTAPFTTAPAALDYFDYYIGFTYSITPKISITPEIGSTIIESRDGRDFFSQKVKYPELALYVDASF